jgi:DNA-directed RNA polymerase subunit F
MEIVEQKSISLPEMDKSIQEMKKRDKELNFRAKKVEEYLKTITKVKEYEKLMEELEGAGISRLKPKHITLIVNIAPTDIDSLRATLSGENITLKDDDLKKIVDIVIKYA